MEKHELPSTYIFCNDVGSLDSISVAVEYDTLAYDFEEGSHSKKTNYSPTEWTQTIRPTTKNGTSCTATHYVLSMQASR